MVMHLVLRGHGCNDWLLAEGSDSVAEGEGTVLESISSHVRAAVATLGGKHGAAGRSDKRRHLYAGFTVWLSHIEASDEDSAREETHRNIKDRITAYTNGCLSALKQLILSNKKLSANKFRNKRW
ncbi:shikimate kinase-like protein, putative [Medicago truncatula]|uniref:Shikimate kinase-like protein, putative n=1 Tax=Medicago truncatula TaxID=3880 RepID=G7I5P9_MEDTR|nr:shikimate kinase-like protein, putative [Medicago truncatula]